MGEQHEYRTKYNNKMKPNESIYLTLISQTSKISTKNEYNKSINRVRNNKMRINEELIL